MIHPTRNPNQHSPRAVSTSLLLNIHIMYCSSPQFSTNDRLTLQTSPQSRSKPKFSSFSKDCSTNTWQPYPPRHSSHQPAIDMITHRSLIPLGYNFQGSRTISLHKPLQIGTVTPARYFATLKFNLHPPVTAPLLSKTLTNLK